jgi:hypothetical protein
MVEEIGMSRCSCPCCNQLLLISLPGHLLQNLILSHALFNPLFRPAAPKDQVHVEIFESQCDNGHRNEGDSHCYQDAHNFHMMSILLIELLL